ncbi:hypothetical protein [Leucobacter chromiireducens]|uniref:CsbD family protein n=1 Tax=Leucobacter chromiireducens subsp. chromiireducens TaxID=660067 RepID=A0ABS1SL88_9MICO|nr:hypothetical protein [Leucobacter chromiireducens]MBL3688370.1 hypothetical protein [Leucobacter chromiireducens subsp. chromiireducens]
MGFLDDAKANAEAAAQKVGKVVEDGIDKAKDKIDEFQAEAEVKKAEAERDAVKARNEAKDEMRDH